jgi:hypothetical protein
MQRRCGGKKRKANTALTHMAGIKVFLKDLTRVEVLAINEHGADGGLIDQLLARKK